MSFPRSKKTMEVIRCRVCHSVITEFEGIYQSPSLYSIACHSCSGVFSDDDLEVMMNLFYLYGGYFGKKKREEFCLETIIDSIGDEIPIDFENLEKINQRVMHVALLYGLSPSEISQLLQEYIESGE